MIDKRPQADRLLIAEIWGEARRRARWRELGSAEEAAAVAELRALAGGRADLLAEVAGVLEGTREGEPDEPLARQAAALCRKAGPDPASMPAWIEEGGAGEPRRGSRRSPAACASLSRLPSMTIWPGYAPGPGRPAPVGDHRGPRRAAA